MQAERKTENNVQIIQITLSPEELYNIVSGGTQGLFLDFLSRIENGVIRVFVAEGKPYILKKPIILKFSPLDDEGLGWEGHILAEPENEEEDLLGWEGIGSPGEHIGFSIEHEAAGDFCYRFAESFKEYALCDEKELTESGLELRKKLWDLVDIEASKRLQAQKTFEDEDGR